MFKKIFKREKKENSNNKNILVAALLIHAAKIDENYSDIEKKIIREALINLNNIKDTQFCKKMKKETQVLTDETTKKLTKVRKTVYKIINDV